MKEVLEFLDKLIEVGKLYGLGGGILAALTFLAYHWIKVRGENWVEDRKNEREHQRRLTRLNDQIERRKNRSKRKE